jgi:hypothetical protein
VVTTIDQHHLSTIDQQNQTIMAIITTAAIEHGGNGGEMERKQH